MKTDDESGVWSPRHLVIELLITLVVAVALYPVLMAFMGHV